MTQVAYLDTWWDLAACNGADPELFFPISRSGLSVLQSTRAKAICGGCRVRQRCLDYAIDSQQVHGIWGGLDGEERLSLHRPVTDG